MRTVENRKIVIIRAQAAAEHEAVVARCESLTAAALEITCADADNRCERLEDGFIRERDRAAVAQLVLADQGAQLQEDQAMVSEVRDTALGIRPRLMSLSSSTRTAPSGSSIRSALR